MLVLLYEDLASNPQGYLDAVCDFIGARRIALDRSNARQAQKFIRLLPPRTPNAIGRRTFAALVWASRHGARPLIALGQRTALWKIMRRQIRRGLPAAKRGIG